MKRIYCEMDVYFRRHIKFHMCEETRFGDNFKMAIAKPLEFEVVPYEPGLEPLRPPSFTLDIQEAQALMDRLWDCGIRPTEGAGSAGAMAATQKHLEDMRSLVFKKEPK